MLLEELGYVVGRARICRWKSQDMLLEELGYVVGRASICC